MIILIIKIDLLELNPGRRAPAPYRNISLADFRILLAGLKLGDLL
jgi:hypothetical protein